MEIEIEDKMSCKEVTNVRQITVGKATLMQFDIIIHHIKHFQKYLKDQLHHK